MFFDQTGTKLFNFGTHKMRKYLNFWAVYSLIWQEKKIRNLEVRRETYFFDRIRNGRGQKSYV